MWGRKKRIYMDTAAATPVDKRVRAAMTPFFARDFGNPSSIHREGVAATRALASARARVAELLGAHPDEIIFTSGGTEGNNLAIFGVLEQVSLDVRSQTSNIVISSIEHASVSEPASKLGATVITVPESGIVDPEEIKKALTPETKLVSVIYANNEVGTIQPIREIARVIRNFRKSHLYHSSLPTPPYLHIDACQAPRFLDLNVARLGVDLMTLNGSKIYGPKGSGCLYVRRGVNFKPLSLGGGQEAGRRSGTENVPGIIGFTEALSLCAKLRDSELARLTRLRDQLIGGLLDIPGVKLNGDRKGRLPNNVNVTFPEIEAEQVVIELDAKGIACSAGSACASNKPESGYDTMGVRFSLGRDTTKADVDYVIKVTNQILKKYARNSVA